MAIIAPFIPYIVAAASAAGAVATSVQQRRVADANEDAQEANNKAIQLAAVAQYGDLSAAERDIQQESVEEGIEQQHQLIKQRGRVNLLAGASGTYGGAVDSMLGDLNQTFGRNLSTITRNRDTQLNEVSKQAEGIRYGAARQMTNRVFAKPSGIATAASAVGSAASAYNTGSRFSGALSESATVSGG